MSDLSMSMPVISGPAAVAAVDEMRFWLLIMEEHAKFVRGGINPTVNQENLIKMADATAILMQGLHIEAARTGPGEVDKVNNLVDRSIQAVTALRNFKVQLYKMLQECRVVSELPASMINHTRHEADYFLTMLYRVKNMAVPPKEVLGIPDGETPTSLVPRRMIPHMGGNIPAIAIEENLFHLRASKEHAEVLLMIAYRPRIQEMLYRATAAYGRKLDRLLKMAGRLPRRPRVIEGFNSMAYRVVLEWRNFLRKVHQDVVKCQVPSGQINAPALILDHMAREAEYYLTVLQIVDSVL